MMIDEETKMKSLNTIIFSVILMLAGLTGCNGATKNKTAEAPTVNENGGVWEGAVLLEQNVTDASQPQISLSSTGKGLAIWMQKAGSNKNDIWSNTYGSEGWGSATKLNDINNWTAESPQITIDDLGNGLAVWSQRDEART